MLPHVFNHAVYVVERGKYGTWQHCFVSWWFAAATDVCWSRPQTGTVHFMNENKYPLTESTVTDRVSNLGRCIL